MEERKSMGSALVDVFDAAVTLVKSEINNVARKVGDVAKAKGIGVVMLLAAVGPLIMGLIFLILTVFYGLMAMGLPAWAAALIIAILSLVVTGLLVMMGLKKLSAEVPSDEPLMHKDPSTMTEDERLEAQYQAEQQTVKQSASKPATVSAPVSGSHVAAGTTTYGVGSEPRSAKDVEGHASGMQSTANSEPVPVYESTPSGQPQVYGDNLNKKLNDDHGDHGHAHDPNIQHPVVLKDQPGITVSTAPTFKEDMKKEGY